MGLTQNNGGMPLATPGREYDLPANGGPSSLNHGQLAEFREMGFLAVDQLASGDDVEYIRGVIERLFQRRTGHNEGAHFNFAGDDDDPDAPQFPQILVPCNYEEGLRKTGLFRQAFAIARQILGPEARFVGDHTLNKPALNGPETPWHQDEAFRDPNFDYEEVSIWVPLQPATKLNGCMYFVPGSNQREVVPHQPIGNNPMVGGLEVVPGSFDLNTAVACELPAGGATFHRERTLHYTPPNQSDDFRRAYIVVGAASEKPRAVPRKFPWKERQAAAKAEAAKAAASK